MTREDAERRIRAVFTNYFYFAGDREADEVIEALRQEPKYCDRNICVRNEYNGIGCGECEVTKSQEPCEDAISRQAVLNILDDMVKDYIKENDFDKAQGVAWVKVQKLTSVSSSENPNKWIPVSERLPEKCSYTLWCASSGYVRSDYFNGEFWEDAKRYCYEVIAWMPLPEPYRAESEDKE